MTVAGEPGNIQGEEYDIDAVHVKSGQLLPEIISGTGCFRYITRCRHKVGLSSGEVTNFY